MTQPPGSPTPPGEPENPQQADDTAVLPAQPQHEQPTPAVPEPVAAQSGPPPQLGYPPAPALGYPGGYQPPFPPQPGYPAQPGQPGFPVQPPFPPTSGVPFPASAPPNPYLYGQFGQPAPGMGKRRGVLIAVIVVVALLVLGGGGAAAWFVISKSPGGKGQASPADAVQGFLTAVYQDADPTKAAGFVCRTSRDQAKLTKKIDEIKRQNATYDTPKYDWTPPKTESTQPSEAILSTTLTLTTANEQSATQTLRFVTTKNNGWWVCEVNQPG